MKAALVTGGAGFIGSHLVHALHTRGVPVRVLDNLSSGSRANLEGSSAELVVGDVADRDVVTAAAEGAEVVFHLAAMISVPESMADPVRCYRENVQGSLHVLEAARRAGARRVVLSSSCAVYGASERPSSETDASQPGSPYAASKIAMEHLGRLYRDVYGLSTVSLRYFNVYGPRQSPTSPYAAVIAAFARAMLDGRAPVIHGDGQQTRDFVYVGDVVQANLLAAEAGQAVPPVVNIGTGHALTIRRLATLLAETLPGAPPPTYAPPRPGDLHASCSDPRLAWEALGFRPAYDLQLGLKHTVEWMRGEKVAPPG
ncbi:MAG TPA: NAD-dependent epimerase/dehydratase family protein [Anaerolineales bacterium]|nr:NAD-dependent epimerase/dehydratase family protein [Anaerolineales bacterium]